MRRWRSKRADYIGCSEADACGRQQRVNLTHWTLDPGDVAPTAGLERDVGQQAATSGLSTPIKSRPEAAGELRFRSTCSERGSFRRPPDEMDGMS